MHIESSVTSSWSIPVNGGDHNDITVINVSQSERRDPHSRNAVIWSIDANQSCTSRHRPNDSSSHASRCRTRFLLSLHSVHVNDDSPPYRALQQRSIRFSTCHKPIYPSSSLRISRQRQRNAKKGTERFDAAAVTKYDGDAKSILLPLMRKVAKKS